jgi:chromosome segregation ATPase
MVELWQAGACISAKRIALTFIPESVIAGNQQEARRIYDKINQLESKRAAMEKEARRFQAHKSACEQEFQAAQRQVVKFSQEDERNLATCRNELDKLRRHHQTRAECREKAHFDYLKKIRNHYADIPFVFELGQVHAEHDSKAINALVGSRLLAAVTDTERQKEDIIRDKRVSGLCCVSLENIRTQHPHRVSPPPNARYAADLVREVRPQYRALWDDLLKDSLVFETEDAMAEYKRRYGYGRHLAAPRADGSWRTVKGIWEVAGDTPKQYVQLAGVPFEESNEYAMHKLREVALLNKQRYRCCTA